MQDIVIEFKYTKDQIKTLYHFGIFPTPSAKYYLFFFTVIIFGVTTISFFTSMDLSSGLGKVYSVLNLILVICATVWCIILVIILITYFFAPKIAYEKNLAYKGKFIIKLSEVNISYTHEIDEKDPSLTTTGTVNWSGFTHKAENAEFIILYQGRKRSAFPKASFKSEAEVSNFRNFLNQRTAIKAKVFNRKLLWNKV